jgi:hypothetical protein
MKTLATNTLFTPIQGGLMELKHRVVMGPLTRSRSVQPGNVPGDLMLEYYSQRASDGGLSDFDLGRWRRMVRGPRSVFGGAGCRVEKNHGRRSSEAWVYVFPTLAYRACRACGLDQRRNPSQFFSQPGILAGSNDTGVYAPWLASAFASPRARHHRNSGHCRRLSQSVRAGQSRWIRWR